MKRKIKDFWDANPCGGKGVYLERLEWMMKREGYIFNILNENLVRDKKCLDIGCGQGFMANHIATWAKEVIGADLSDKSIAVAEMGRSVFNKRNVRFFVGDAEKLSFRDGYFDLIFSIGVLHHTSDPPRAVKEMVRVARPHGTIILMLYRKYSPKGLLVCAVRSISSILDLIFRKNYFLYHCLSKWYLQNPRYNHGTALSELVGSPILKLYSKKQILRLTRMLKKVQISCYQPGINRLIDFIPFLKWNGIGSLLAMVDKAMIRSWGFYWVIKGEK